MGPAGGGLCLQSRGQPVPAPGRQNAMRGGQEASASPIAHSPIAHGGSSQSPFTDGMKDPAWVVPSRINFPEKKYFSVSKENSHI